MKKLAILFFVILSFVAVGFFTGCEDSTGSVTPPADPPAEEIINWIDTVPGGFFQLVSVSDYGTFSRSSGDVTTINDVYIVFEDDGDISLWYDNEPNGILEPEDYVGSAGTWELTDGVLTIDGEEFFIASVEQDAWCMTMDISDEFEDCLGEAGYEVEGTRTFCYERAYPTYMTPDMLITTEFPFAFSDRNETGFQSYLETEWASINYVSWNVYHCGHYTWYHTYPSNQDVLVSLDISQQPVLLDDADGFLFNWGDVVIAVVTTDANDKSFLVTKYDGNVIVFDQDVDGNDFVFQDSAVYDMSVEVQTNDIAYFTFTSRLDSADTFIVPALITYSDLGDIVIRAVNDVSGLVL